MDIDGITPNTDDNSIRILGIQNNDIELIIDEVVKSVNQVTGVT